MDLSISTQTVTLTQILVFVEFYYILTDFTIESDGIAVVEYCGQRFNYLVTLFEGFKFEDLFLPTYY